MTLMGQWRGLGVAFFRVAEVPEALMRGDQAFDAFAAVGVGGDGAAGEHAFQDVEELLADFVVALVAGVVEGDENFVRQPAAIAGRSARLL